MPLLKRPATIAVAAVMALLLAAVPAAGADSLSTARQQREAARAHRAALAGRIDALKASDDQLQGAVSALDAQVAGQQASADTARRSVAAAVASADAATARADETERHIGALRQAVIQRAVAAYERPQEDALAGFAGARDLNEASRRAALLSHVAGRDGEVLDRLRSARQDLGDQKRAAAQARDVAAARRKAVLSRLDSLQRSLLTQRQLSDALRSRIQDYQQEADQVAAQESGLVALIQTKESALRASRGGDTVPDGRVSGAGLIRPVGGPITSPFGFRWGRLHAGIDFGAGEGTPIHAAKAGAVVFAGVMQGYGNVIVIDHGGGFSTLYAHQSRLAASEGQSVSQGEVVGYSGNTGHSTGPHLHFETRVNGTPQDPMRYL